MVFSSIANRESSIQQFFRCSVYEEKIDLIKQYTLIKSSNKNERTQDCELQTSNS